MKAYDVRAETRELATLTIVSGETSESAGPWLRMLAPFNQCTLGTVRFVGRTPWERHPDGDELLHVLQGEVEVTVLTEAGPVQATVAAGSIFVVPRGLWHRQTAVAPVTLLFATATERSEHTWAEDPQV
jgi:mannose-6-phosphate isomerase-like protein (cupin superfamily)